MFTDLVIFVAYSSWNTPGWGWVLCGGYIEIVFID